MLIYQLDVLTDPLSLEYAPARPTDAPVLTYQKPTEAWLVVPVVVVVSAVTPLLSFKALYGGVFPAKSVASRTVGNEAAAPPVALTA